MGVRKRGALLSALLAASLLAACAGLEVDLALNDDGSGTLTLQAVFNRQLLDEVSGEPSSPATLLRDAGIEIGRLPDGVAYEPIDTPESVGVRFSVPFAASEDIPAEIDRAFSSLGPDAGTLVGPGGLFQSFTLAHGDAGWTFEAVSAASDSPDGLSALLTRDATLVFRLRLPGEVTSNATHTSEDGTHEWTIPIDGASHVLSARSHPADGSSLPLGQLSVAIGLVVAAAAIAALALARRRRGRPRRDPLAAFASSEPAPGG